MGIVPDNFLKVMWSTSLTLLEEKPAGERLFT
jgi:hypothetical protein